jgi:hypothetical protein
MNAVQVPAKQFICAWVACVPRLLAFPTETACTLMISTTGAAAASC